ncbi:metal ABC transporter substrate-binding protein [Hydrogenimonas cancrithermarum]|uniref:Adhesin n=1 Tax=Hydrogenimonas cancrithermarum TaxID=2993563 RepID=A0ABN6WUR6_9BACT|nr:zinc ABC transporter substrate-binding protein [Hydrogenimonas cancrithermarum]BDY11887.1 adhesin [Hydrogenimonas cancrithermarum]
MKKIFIALFAFTTLLSAKVNVVTTYPYLAETVKAVGGNLVRVKALASARMDPHFIVPKPSLIPLLSRADMLVMNGAGLEIGWLPPLLKRAHNPKIQPGSIGFVDASQVIDLLDKPAAVSRAYGDVHPEGNPHYALDPHNIVRIAKLVAYKLETIDPAHRSTYEANLEKFLERWNDFLKDFDMKMHRCKGMKVVQYHELYNYLLKRYGIVSVGTIEPLPGIAPSSKHTIELIRLIQKEGIGKILQDLYHERKTARFIVSKTGAEVVLLPHDVGAVNGADTLQTFYETIAKRLCR